MGFLEDLYRYGYNPSEYDFPRTEEYNCLREEIIKREELIIEKMGSDFLDEYSTLKSEQYNYEFSHVYAQGVSFVLNLVLSGMLKKYSL